MPIFRLKILVSPVRFLVVPQKKQKPLIPFGIKGFCFSQGKTSDVSVPIFK